MGLYEDEPNESYAMRQRMQPHGGQLMMTTQVTTKVPPGFDGKTVRRHGLHSQLMIGVT